MTYIPMLLLAAACLIPVILLFWRPGQARGRRESALTLHRAQLADLDRDLAEGRLAPAEHASAQLEVQRRMLRAAEGTDPESIALALQQAPAGEAPEAGQQPMRRFGAKVGRNDPCPCGSGKKYKKCCLNAAEAGAPPARLPGLS